MVTDAPHRKKTNRKHRRLKMIEGALHVDAWTPMATLAGHCLITYLVRTIAALEDRVYPQTMIEVLVIGFFVSVFLVGCASSIYNRWHGISN